MYDLAAAVGMRDIGKAHEFTENVQAGIVWVNTSRVVDSGDVTARSGCDRVPSARRRPAAAVLEERRRRRGEFVVGPVVSGPRRCQPRREMCERLRHWSSRLRLRLVQRPNPICLSRS